MAYKIWDLSSMTIQSSKGSYAGTGRVEITDEGRVNIFVSIPGNIPFAHGAVTVTGKTPTGLELIGSGAHIVHGNFGAQSDLTIKPLRCQIFDPAQRGKPWTQQNIAIKNAKFWNNGSLSVAGYDVELEMLPGKDSQRVQAGEVTSVLRIRSRTHTTANIHELIFEICQLLGLAHRCQTPPVEHEVIGPNGFIHAELNEMTQDQISTAPLINSFGNDICSFIQTVWAPFQANKRQYNLSILIEYYCRAHTESYAEIKFLFASVFMEALKFNWALNVATNLDQDKLPNGLIRGFRYQAGHVPPGKKAGKLISFGSLLVQTANHLGIPAVEKTPATATAPATPGTYTFIEDRNAIFHSGQASAAQLGHNAGIWPILKPELYKLYDQMDELLLAILAYTGNSLPGHP